MSILYIYCMLIETWCVLGGGGKGRGVCHSKLPNSKMGDVRLMRL